jgi:hypothetical protein
MIPLEGLSPKERERYLDGTWTDTPKKCKVVRCKRRPSSEGLCKTHLKQKKDRQWSQAVRDRDGRCMVAERFPKITCSVGLQAMHLVPRGYHKTRWDLDNGLTGCGAHHSYLTHHPLEHDEACRAILGGERWDALRRRALGLSEDDSLKLTPPDLKTKRGERVE